MSLSNPKILLVEDDKTLSEMYTLKFQEEGIQLLLAEDGAAGLEMAEREMPDAILLDIMMPKMDGFAVLSALRKNSKTKDMPVLMLSNLGQKTDVEKATELGANSYIIKATMTPTQVLAKVKEYLK